MADAIDTASTRYESSGILGPFVGSVVEVVSVVVSVSLVVVVVDPVVVVVVVVSSVSLSGLPK